MCRGASCRGASLPSAGIAWSILVGLYLLMVGQVSVSEIVVALIFASAVGVWFHLLVPRLRKLLGSGTVLVVLTLEGYS